MKYDTKTSIKCMAVEPIILLTIEKNRERKNRSDFEYQKNDIL